MPLPNDTNFDDDVFTDFDPDEGFENEEEFEEMEQQTSEEE